MNCCSRSEQPNAIESDVLAQMHRHLMTCAQLHGCTLVANCLALEGSNAAVPYKAISTPIRDEARRVIGVLAVFRVDTDGDFQLRDAEALELLARKAHRAARHLPESAAAAPGEILPEPLGGVARRRRILAGLGRTGAQESHRACLTGS
jgi:hypothetical protein